MSAGEIACAVFFGVPLSSVAVVWWLRFLDRVLARLGGGR